LCIVFIQVLISSIAFIPNVLIRVDIVIFSDDAAGDFDPFACSLIVFSGGTGFVCFKTRDREAALWAEGKVWTLNGRPRRVRTRREALGWKVGGCSLRGTFRCDAKAQDRVVSSVVCGAEMVIEDVSAFRRFD
jgi:hypothetical protein